MVLTLIVLSFDTPPDTPQFDGLGGRAGVAACKAD
jgi:hypothetical protein